MDGLCLKDRLRAEYRIHASAEDESKDIRKYLPIMASATVDYIGQDSSTQKTIRVRADGADVDFIRKKGMASTEPATPAAAPVAPAPAAPPKS